MEIVPEPYGWTRFRPGAGFLRDIFDDYYLVHWEITEGWAVSEQLPGVRIPNGSFMGTSGIAPSKTQMETWTKREADLIARGGMAFPPDSEDAVPGCEPIASEGLRTGPPRARIGYHSG